MSFFILLLNDDGIFIESALGSSGTGIWEYPLGKVTAQVIAGVLPEGNRPNSGEDFNRILLVSFPSVPGDFIEDTGDDNLLAICLGSSFLLLSKFIYLLLDLSRT